ncbi:BglG family transcription antiterminator [Clostridium polynesiense]|uniref:BglG family transcription antiterminator n=1 Tax=Clostridium polynesiense TaxID=1325933 RepID=UPI00058F489B|nr:PRD domain-containing protein [Clostridium polynesiense]
MLTKRQVKITELLLRNPGGIVGGEVGNIFGVTDRTIRKDIRAINKSMEEFSCRISSSNKIGYYIEEKDSKVFKRALRKLITNKQHKYDLVERYYIVIGLILFNEKLYITEIEEKLNVSDQTLYKDLCRIQESIFEKSLINLFEIGEEYILCKCGEASKRKIYLKILKEARVENPNFYNFNIINLFGSEYDGKLVEVLRRDVEEYFSSEGIDASDYTIYFSVWAIYFFVIRNEKNHFLTEIEFKKDCGRVFTNLLFHIQNKGYLITSQDILFLKAFFRTTGLVKNTDKSDEKLSEIVFQEFYQKVFVKYGIDLKKNKSICSNIISHIKYLLRRLNVGYETKNPLKASVKEKYNFAYEVAMNLVPIIYKNTDKYLSEDEVSFIAVYLQCYITENCRRIKFVFIYEGSEAVKVSLIQWLKRNFSCSIEYVNYSDADKYLSMNEIDIIISNLNINISDNTPIYVIQELPEDTDRNNILWAVKKRRLQSLYIKAAKSRFKDNLIKIYDNPIALEDAIFDLCKELYLDKSIYDLRAFYEDTVNREKLYPTSMSDWIMAPHPINDCGIKSSVAVGIFKRPLKDKEKEISMIFIPCIKNKDENDIDILFYMLKAIAANRRVFKQMIKIKGKEDFLPELMASIGLIK